MSTDNPENLDPRRESPAPADDAAASSVATDVAPPDPDEAAYATVHASVESLGIPTLAAATAAPSGHDATDPTLATVAVQAVPAPPETTEADLARPTLEPADAASVAHATTVESATFASAPVESATLDPAPVESATEVAPPAAVPPTTPTAPTATAPTAAAPSLAKAIGHDEPLRQAMDVMGRLRNRMRAQVLGRDEVIDLVLVALLSDGHVLLEDFPGSGKTTLAKSLGDSIVDHREHNDGQQSTDGIAPFRRIQFTPDLLPSDVTGVSVFDPVSNQFHFRHGPIFAHVLLADEINRTSPKVQSAMLEAMAEKQVTVDNVTHALDPLFFVIATQNPLDLAGTYPLPVAQLDRFLFKIRMDHIDRGSELEVLQTYRSRRDTVRADLPKVTRDELLAAREALDHGVAIDPRIQEALVDISQALRNDERVAQGNSTRSLVLLLPALQARAALAGRDYVASDDLEHLLPRVLGHRVELAPGVGDLEVVLREAMETSIEGLARSTLRSASTLSSTKRWG